MSVIQFTENYKIIGDTWFSLDSHSRSVLLISLLLLLSTADSTTTGAVTNNTNNSTTITISSTAAITSLSSISYPRAVK